ncbi:hypothetical protein WMW72_30155 [Paenibacillus filicis]|uniref:Uncharacterized protein n=1 Tax=Paenibacillus filicis TaxID=669464 RepID=A0ABU9DTG3_9BACL
METNRDQSNRLNSANREEARKLLEQNPDIVFQERLRLDISEDAAEFWLKFTAEWGGALYLLDETNKKRFEHGLLDEQSYEGLRRTYRLGLITLSELHDRLKAWKEQGMQDGSFVYSMSSIDCFLIPGYLDDFSRVHEAGSDACRYWIDAIRNGLSVKVPIEQAVGAIHAMVSEYILRLHIYAAGR